MHDDREPERGERRSPRATIEIVGESELREFVATWHFRWQPVYEAKARDDEGERETRDTCAEDEENHPDVLRGFGGAGEPRPIPHCQERGESDETNQANDPIHQHGEHRGGPLPRRLLEQIEN